MQSSTELRAILAALETASEAAGAQLIQAETELRAQLRRSVAENDYTLSATSEAALAAARVAFDRAKTSTEVARDMLTEATKREKAEAEDASRADIRSKFAEMTTLARSADEDLANLVGKIRRIHAIERGLHTQTLSELGRRPWMATQANSAFRSVASALTTVANSDADTRTAGPVVSKAIEGAVQNIEGAFEA